MQLLPKTMMKLPFILKKKKMDMQSILSQLILQKHILKVKYPLIQHVVNILIQVTRILTNNYVYVQKVLYQMRWQKDKK